MFASWESFNLTFLLYKYFEWSGWDCNKVIGKGTEMVYCRKVEIFSLAYFDNSFITTYKKKTPEFPFFFFYLTDNYSREREPWS